MRPWIAVSGALIAAGVALFLYKVLVLGYPLSTAEEPGTWRVDFVVTVTGRGSRTVVEVPLPRTSGYQRLLTKHLDGIRLVEGLSVEVLAERLKGISPADLEAVCNSAKRMAMRRMADTAEELPPLVWNDFTEAMKRVQVQ